MASFESESALLHQASYFAPQSYYIKDKNNLESMFNFKNSGVWARKAQTPRLLTFNFFFLNNGQELTGGNLCSLCSSHLIECLLI